MYLIDLQQLRPGDVVLEEGDVRVGQRTGGDFGHASLAIGRLLFVEALKSEGVRLSGFSPQLWQWGDCRVVGHQVDQAAVAPKVMRLVPPRETAEIYGLAVGELGRSYALDAAAKLPDIDEDTRGRFVRLITRRPSPSGPPDAQGRSCSEVVAVILGLNPVEVSPSGLAHHSRLTEVPGAVVDARQGKWEAVRSDIARAQIGATLASVRSGLAQELHRAAQEVWAGRNSPDAVPLTEVAGELEKSLDAALHLAIPALVDLDRQAEDLLR